MKGILGRFPSFAQTDRILTTLRTALPDKPTDCYVNGNGCIDGYSYDQLRKYQVDYGKWLCNAVHSYDMAVGMFSLRSFACRDGILVCCGV